MLMQLPGCGEDLIEAVLAINMFITFYLLCQFVQTDKAISTKSVKSKIATYFKITYDAQAIHKMNHNFKNVDIT